MTFDVQAGDVNVNAILEAAAAEVAPAAAKTEASPKEAEKVAEIVPPDAEKKVETLPDAEKQPETPPDVEKPAEQTQAVREQAEKLQRIAAQRHAERTARMQAEHAVTTLRQENAEFKTRLERLEAREKELAAFERDPLEWYTNHSRDPVEFLQKAHRVALNPQARKAEETSAELEKRLKALEERGNPQETVQSALQARELEAAQQNLVAQSEATDNDGQAVYPLFSSETPAVRIAMAQSAARQFKQNGQANFSFSDLCGAIEKALLNEYQQKTARLTAARPQPKTPQAEPVKAETLANEPKAKTVTQTHVATDTGNTREMTQAERDAAADKVIHEQFFSALH